MQDPDERALRSARDLFRALLDRRTREAEWQTFFAENPFVFSRSLPLRLDPRDVRPLARPGKTEPDFVFYPQDIRPLPYYGIIELKRPDTTIFTTPRTNVALFTRDAESAIWQADSYARNPGGLVPIERPDKMLFLGNNAHIFVIMGTSQELTAKLSLEIYHELIARRLPRNLQILPFDTLLKMFEATLAPRLLFLVPGTDSTFEFNTVVLDAYGNVRDRRSLVANQVVETLAPGAAFEMVSIPGGSFLMGAPAGEQNSYDDERPQHRVTISPFHMGKFPVTQSQWRAVASLPKVSRNLDPAPSHFKGEHRPVEQVSWDDATEFCERLSRATGKIYRLPSEAQWEYACRAGTDAPFGFGETITPEFVNYHGNYPYGNASKGPYREETIVAGSLYSANRFGLFDMHGNVWEWCQDVWHENYVGAPEDGSAWETGGDSSRRRLRGGSWFDFAYLCRSAYRDGDQPDLRYNDIGFRVVVWRTR
jgi:formylglycine-generating enzyme required for sulfatase activity